MLSCLCRKLKENDDLVNFFFMASNNNNEDGRQQFMIFRILNQFIHQKGDVGQLARDSLLNCLVLSKNNEQIVDYILKHSNFCHVLATGLSGLYSLLPRHLPEHWVKDSSFHKIAFNEISLQSTPELAAFLDSLKFCNDVVQASNAKIMQQLLALIYMGFLVPVLGPALTQVSRQSFDTLSYKSLNIS